MFVPEAERDDVDHALAHARTSARQTKEQNVALQACEDRRQGFEEGLKQSWTAFTIEDPTDLELIEAEPKQPPRKSNPPPPPPDTSRSEAEAARVLLEITEWERLRVKSQEAVA